MTVTATPYLFVAGTQIANTAIPGGLVGIGSLRLTWGRAGLLDQPTPATVAATVLDLTPGATFARRTDLKGQELRIEWFSSTEGHGVMFRGRVTDVAVRPRRAGGFVVELSGSSKEVDAANYTVPEGTTWPAETMSARLARIVALAPGLFGGGVQLPTVAAVGLVSTVAPGVEFANYPAAPADVGGADMLSLLHDLWRSLYPLPLIYDPAEDALTYIRSRRHYVDTGAGGALVGQLVRGPSGRYVAAPFATLPLALDAGVVEFDAPLSQPMETALTRVEVAFTDPGTGAQATTTTGTALYAAEATIGRRTLSVASLLRDGPLANQLANAWAQAMDEAALPALVDPIVYRPDTTGGFADDTTVEVLLAGRERPAEVFLGRSWLTRLGVRPVVGVCGGVTTFAAGAWEFALNTAPITVDKPLRRPVVADDHPPAVTLADLDRSVAVGDLRHVQIAAGRTYFTQPWS